MKFIVDRERDNTHLIRDLKSAIQEQINKEIDDKIDGSLRSIKNNMKEAFKYNMDCEYAIKAFVEASMRSGTEIKSIPELLHILECNESIRDEVVDYLSNIKTLLGGLNISGTSSVVESLYNEIDVMGERLGQLAYSVTNENNQT